MKVNPVKGFKRALDPEDATRHQKSMRKIRERIEALAKRKKASKSGEKSSVEDKLFGNEEI